MNLLNCWGRHLIQREGPHHKPSSSSSSLSSYNTQCVRQASSTASDSGCQFKANRPSCRKCLFQPLPLSLACILVGRRHASRVSANTTPFINSFQNTSLAMCTWHLRQGDESFHKNYSHSRFGQKMLT